MSNQIIRDTIEEFDPEEAESRLNEFLAPVAGAAMS